MKDIAMLEAELKALTEEVAQLRPLKDEVAELRTDIKGLVEAWNTASGLAKFVKWIASIATAVGVVYALFRTGAPVP